MDVSPVYFPQLHIAEDGSRWIVIESFEKLKSQSERAPLLSALETWAASFRVTEIWIFEAALDTLSTYSLRQPGAIEREWLWRYNPRGFHPPFTPILENSVWYPPERGWHEPWDAFKRRIESQFSNQLAAYRRMVESKFGIGKEMMARDAAWAVRYQKGESAIEIAESAGLIGYADPEQAVFKAINKFAASISLKLKRRSERIRKTSVPPRA